MLGKIEDRRRRERQRVRGWMASLTQWTWVWANSGRWWRARKPGVLQSMGSQRVGHNWATEPQQPAAHRTDSLSLWCCQKTSWVSMETGKQSIVNAFWSGCLLGLSQGHQWSSWKKWSWRVAWGWLGDGWAEKWWGAVKMGLGWPQTPASACRSVWYHHQWKAKHEFSALDCSPWLRHHFLQGGRSLDWGSARTCLPPPPRHPGCCLQRRGEPVGD